METFGLLFAVFLLAAFSVTAVIIAYVVFRRRANSLSMTAIAFVGPSLLLALWLTGCYTVQQVKSATGHKHFWFFEAVCPLTGDYDLTYDAKFQRGAIAKHGANPDTAPVRDLGALEVISPLIVGQYADNFGRPLKNHYFVFNTQTGSLQNFDSRDSLEMNAGRSVQLKSLDETFSAAR
jgi:hypothetical protein